MVSSGAVYGEQPLEVGHMPETHVGMPDTMDPCSAYGEGKRAAELLCAIYHREHGIATTIARCFAFVGPYLPVDAHFAIGNFIRDAMRGGPIQVNGDGTAYRSYLYTADLAIWLWTILFRGAGCRPYNVGSENDLSIEDLAREVAAALNPAASVRIAKPAPPGQESELYVPSTKRAQREWSLKEYVPLRDAIHRTALSYGYESAHGAALVA
jgi:dTDP-glucose 4,6-dehydratase